MSRNMRRIALVGLPESGKTTFVAALYHVLQQPEENFCLTLTKTPPDSTYLDKIAKYWLNNAPMPHTASGTFEPINLQIREKQSNQEFVITFPDLSGEEFNHQWELREWNGGYRDLSGEIDGILLFIHPSIVKPLTIQDRDTVIGEGTPQDVPDTNTPYEAKDAPTGIKLIELLQFIREVVPEGKSIYLATIISAWDIEANIPGRKAYRPSDWLSHQIPLLYQYLLSNDDWLISQVFGVSAQGGDYETDIEKLTGLGALKKIQVVTDSSQSNDISIPIRWAAGLSDCKPI